MTLLRLFVLIVSFSTELGLVSGFDEGFRSRTDWLDFRGCYIFMFLSAAASIGPGFYTVASSAGLICSCWVKFV